MLNNATYSGKQWIYDLGNVIIYVHKYTISRVSFPSSKWSTLSQFNINLANDNSFVELIIIFFLFLHYVDLYDWINTYNLLVLLLQYKGFSQNTNLMQ